MNKYTVLALVVTYNRLSDLKVCIDALRRQSYEKIQILVVNNGSTDGTAEWLAGQSDLAVINQSNLGGAGGFYAGMKYMQEHEYAWLVMMDDDGIPDENEIKNLVEAYPTIVKKEGKPVILNALVANKDDREHTAFIWARGSGRTSEIKELRKIPYFNDVHPFNGTLISREVVNKIGLIKKEMFIWGDEKEYMARAVHNGVGLFTLTSALHYHPKEKGNRGNIIPFVSRYQILLKPHKMSHYYYRNEGFIYHTYPEKRKKVVPFYLAHVIRFLSHFEWKELVKFIRYFRMGAKNQYQ